MGNLNEADLGSQFAEKHEVPSQGGRANTAHIYINRGDLGVCCSLNMFHLLKQKDGHAHCYEYVVTVLIDGHLAGKFVASAAEVQECNHFIITPMRKLMASQGTYKMRIVERQIRPIESYNEDMTWSTFQIDYLYFSDSSHELIERPLFKKRPYQHIAAMSWKLWSSRESERKQARLSDRREPDQELNYDHRRSSADSIRLRKLSDRLSDNVFEERLGERAVPPHSSLLERLETPAAVKIESKVQMRESRVWMPTTPPPINSKTEKIGIDAALPVSSTRPFGTPRDIATLMLEKEVNAESKEEGSVMEESVRPPLDRLVTARPACLDPAALCTELENVEIDSPGHSHDDRAAAAGAATTFGARNIVGQGAKKLSSRVGVDEKEASRNDAAHSNKKDNSEHTELPKVVLIEAQPAWNAEDCLLAGPDSPSRPTPPPSWNNKVAQSQPEARKRSASSDEEVSQKRQRVEEAQAKQVKYERRMILIAEEEEAIEAEIAKEIAKRQCFEREQKMMARKQYLADLRTGDYKADSYCVRLGRDPRRQASDAGSQKRVTTWVDGDVTAEHEDREDHYQGEVPFSPLSMQSPLLVHNASPPHPPRQATTAASTMPAPSLPKPKMQKNKGWDAR